jgi:hypothetical protein
MRARTILLLGTPAVIAAVAVAVPALAGLGVHPASSGPKATSAATRKPAHSSKERCFYTGSGKHRTRVCELTGPAGPRGPRGPRGFVGAHGKRGFSGPQGSTGLTGPSGVARAYALVSVRGGLQLVANMSHEFVAVKPVGTGVYCLAPAVPTRPNEVAAVVSGESAYSMPGTIPLAVLNAAHPSCPGGEYEVETFKVNGKTGPEPSSEAAFTIVAP